MVVDDSAVARGLIARQLNTDPKLEVVCTAANGELALAELRRRAIDIVVLDIEMPVMDGITALTHIVADFPSVRVIMASTITRRNAEISMKALQLGASDYIAKPEAGLGGAEEFKRDLTSKVKALAGRRSRPHLALASASTASTAPVATARQGF
ncbi:MAG: response regulator, partial [Alphaproteobacteria bacterium]